MELKEYKFKRNETVKRLYRAGETLGFIASRFAIDTNLVRDIVGLARPEEKVEDVLRVVHKGYGA